MVSNQKRITWIDFTKGILIIMMLLGHKLPYGSMATYIRIWIYSFHIPAFFVVSGLTINLDKYGIKDFLIKKIKSFIVPIICFGIFQTLFDFVYYYKLLHNYSFSKIMKEIVGIFIPIYGKTEVMYWFIYCLFFAEVILFFINRIKNKRIVTIVFLGVSLVGFLNANCTKICLPFLIEKSFIAVFFLYIGYIINKKQILEKIKIWHSIVFLFVNIVFIYLNTRIIHTNLDLARGIIGNPIYFIFESFFGSLFIISVCKKISKDNIVSKVGRDSLIYYMLGDWLSFVPNIIIYNILDFKLNQMGNWNILIGVGSVCVIIMLIYPIAFIVNSKLIKTKFSFIVGK